MSIVYYVRAALIAGWTVYCIITWARRAKRGKCCGDCSRCGGCPSCKKDDSQKDG